MNNSSFSPQPSAFPSKPYIHPSLFAQGTLAGEMERAYIRACALESALFLIDAHRCSVPPLKPFFVGQAAMWNRRAGRHAAAIGLASLISAPPIPTGCTMSLVLYQAPPEHYTAADLAASAPPDPPDPPSQ